MIPLCHLLAAVLRSIPITIANTIPIRTQRRPMLRQRRLYHRRLVDPIARAHARARAYTRDRAQCRSHRFSPLQLSLRSSLNSTISDLEITSRCDLPMWPSCLLIRPKEALRDPSTRSLSGLA